MNFTPIIFFIIAVVLLIFLVLRIVKSKADTENSELGEEVNNTPGGIINIEISDYKDQILKQVFYSTISSFDTGVNSIHSIDNALFLRFENDIWLNIMFNSEMDLYQIENSNPNKLDLEYSLEEMTLSSFWKQFKGEVVTNLSIKFDKERGFDLPKDLILQFKNDQVAICFSDKMLEKNKIYFGQEWLYLILGEAEYNRTRI